ncbi:hypothetical protein BJY01DRAFT_210997, partial [Aspergillus pseudoustus]
RVGKGRARCRGRSISRVRGRSSSSSSSSSRRRRRIRLMPRPIPRTLTLGAAADTLESVPSAMWFHVCPAGTVIGVTIALLRYIPLSGAPVRGDLGDHCISACPWISLL